MTLRYTVTGSDLRRARRLRDLRQVDVAAALGVGRTRVSHVEGLARVPETFAERYLAALHELAVPELAGGHR
jgi:hypothetical protein